MRLLFSVFAIATVAACSSGPIFFNTPPGTPPDSPGPATNNPVSTTRPALGASGDPTVAVSRGPIALPRAIEPKESLLANPLMVELVAGGTYGDKDGTGADAQLADPTNLTIDLQGNLIVVQNGDKVLRRVSPTGVVTTVTGTNGKPLEFKKPKGGAIDKQGNLYVADGAVAGNVIKVEPDGTKVALAGDGTSGFKDGRGEEARFSQLESICVTADGVIFVGEHGGRIRKILPDGDTTTYAGGGATVATLDKPAPAIEANFFYPASLLMAPSGRLLVADKHQEAISWVSPDGKLVNKRVGNGLGFVDGANPHNKFSKPSQLAMDAQNNIYVADSWNNAVRKVSPDGVVTTLVGDGYDGKVLGKNDRARLYQPQGVAVTRDGTLYIADSGNNRIVKVKLPI